MDCSPTSDNIFIQGLISEREKVRVLMNEPMTEGSLWYLLNIKWWDKWKLYVKYDKNDLNAYSNEEMNAPLKIDNSELLDHKSLRSNLFVNSDIIFVPDTVWDILSKSYGCAHTDNSLFERRALKLSNGLCDLDLYPPHYIFKNLNDIVLFEQSFSKIQTIDNVKNAIRTRLKCPANVKIRLLLASKDVVGDSYLDTTLAEASLQSESVIFVQFSINGRNWTDTLVEACSDYSPISKPTCSTFGLFSSSKSNHDDAARGLCGLTNLGNTCFMNSAIQCMSNVPQLTEYFIGSLSGKSKNPSTKLWESELNTTNPLGMKGRIAKTYADLVNKMWLDPSKIQTPRHFKTEVSKFAPQFSGYAQHDSQELMMFVLDGLHEDLNRIIKKPYIEVKDADGRPDEEVAAEAWNMHKARNDSIIVDLFHGQLKSTVVCPKCNYVSVTFDPYASLSLPLPDPTKYTIKILVWPYERPTIADWRPGNLLAYVLKLETKLSLSMMRQELEKYRPTKPPLKYYFAVVKNYSVLYYLQDELKKFDSDCWLMAYELPDGQLAQVKFLETRTQNSHMRYIGNSCYISLQKHEAKNGLENAPIRAHIDMRLHALGLLPSKLLNSSQSSVFEGDLDEDTLPSVATHTSPESNGDSHDTNESRITKTSEHLYKISYKSYSSILWHNIEAMVTDSRLSELIQSVHADNAYPCNDQALNFDRSMEAETRDLYLEDCLKRFTELERLSEHDLWFCKKCREHQQATKKFDLWTLPQVLVIHLKRFRSEYRHHDKINYPVIFPTDGLDMTKWVKTKKPDEKLIYDLTAVSNHMGFLGGGHYTAYAKNNIFKRWYHFDDTSVSSTDTRKISYSAAYVLVYVRRTDAVNLNNNFSLPSCINQSNITSDGSEGSPDAQEANSDDADVESSDESSRINFTSRLGPGSAHRITDAEDMMGVE